MPFVIPKSGRIQYIPSEEVLGEILGHSNFDGEDWAIGDRIIFEDGTQAQIKQEPGEQFFIWGESVPAKLEEVKRYLGEIEATDWNELFAPFEAQSHIQVARQKSFDRILVIGCAFTLILAAAALVAYFVWP